MRLRRLPALLAAGAAAVLVLAGCSPSAETSAEAAGLGDQSAADLTLEGVDGPVTLPAIPQRVVVLDYAALDTLKTLGLDQAVVGTATELLPESLSSFASVTNVGTFQEPNVETIAGLTPDLILISARTASSAALPELQALAPTVNIAVDNKDWLNSATARALDLAALYGAQGEAQPLVDAITTKAADTKAKLAAAGPGLFISVSGGKISAYAPGSRFGLVYQDLGLVPAAEISNADRHGQEISFEFIAQTNPKVLYVLDRDQAIGKGVEGQAAQQVLANDLVNATDAAKNGKIVYVKPADWYLVGGGLTTISTMLDEIGAAA